MEGFISLHRSLLEWEWWEDHNTTRVFLYLLLKANFQAKKWQGIDIKRGQLLTSYERIIKETGLTLQQVRTSVSKLKSTGSLTITATSKYTIITVCKYDSYQILKTESNKQNNKQNNTPATNEQQTNNKRITTTNNENNYNNVNNANTPPKAPQGERVGLDWIDELLTSKINWTRYEQTAYVLRTVYDLFDDGDFKTGKCQNEYIECLERGNIKNPQALLLPIIKKHISPEAKLRP